MRRLYLWLLEWQYLQIEAQIANGEALVRGHKETLEQCYAQRSRLERRINVLRMQGNPQPLINQALKRSRA